jgi:hypothetical protein
MVRVLRRWKIRRAGPDKAGRKRLESGRAVLLRGIHVVFEKIFFTSQQMSPFDVDVRAVLQ